MTEYLHLKYVLLPDDTIKLAWDIIILLYCLLRLLIYTITITPFRVAFVENDTNGWYVTDLVVDFCFLFDVFVNSISAYYKEEDVLITSNKEILKNYLKSWMLIDIFTSLPYSLIFAGQYSEASRLGRLPKIYRLIKVAKLMRVMKFLKSKNKFLECLECFSKISVGVERLLYFFLIFVGLVHILSCLWFFMSRISDDLENWVVKYKIQDRPIGSQYLASFYWTITTLTTVGYGDITPANSIEQFFCIFVMLGGVFFYSYTIGTITSVIGQIEKRKSKLQSKILVLQDITKKYNLTKNFYKRIKSDLEYDQSKISKERNNMIANLPKKLATKLNYIMNQKFIEGNKFFQERPLEFTTAVLRFLRPLRAKPKEVIFKKGDYSDEMFFVKTGELTYFESYKTIDITYEEINDQDYFGDIEIFFSDLREFSVKAIKNSEILSLFRDDLFNHILHNFELLKIPLIFEAKKRREKIMKCKNDAMNEYLETKNLINDIAPNIEGTGENSSEINTFKRKFIKLRNTLSPATRVLLESGQSGDQLEDIKSNIRLLTERFKRLERHFDEKQESVSSMHLKLNESSEEKI